MWCMDVNHEKFNEDENKSKCIRVLVKDMYRWELVRSWLRNGRQWIFRGQGNSAWELSNGIERDVMPSPVFSDEQKIKFEKGWFDLERKNIQTFQDRFDSYFQGRARPQSMVGWLALMQHYGLTTRLLDFSRSLNVASYMATEKRMPTSRAFSIWAVDVKGIGVFRVGDSSDDKTFIEQQLTDDSYSVAKESLKYQNRLAIIENLSQEDRNANWRIGSQQGLFVAPCSFPCVCRGVISQLFIGGSYLEPLFRCPYFNYSGLPPDHEWEFDEKLLNSAVVIEFVFPGGLMPLVRGLAESHDCCDETMYPDAMLVSTERLKAGIDCKQMCGNWPYI